MPRRGLEPPRDFTPTSTSSWRVCQFRHLGCGSPRESGGSRSIHPPDLMSRVPRSFPTMGSMTDSAPERSHTLRTAESLPSTSSIRLNEIFHSIHGESSRAGESCIFVRLSGCHLRCSWCDTEYAFREGTRREVASVLEEVLAIECPVVEITGGEPLLQKAVHQLERSLLDAGRIVMIETSGACDIAACDPRTEVVMDMKAPSSGECGRNLDSNIEALLPHHEVKFVIGNREDYEWSRDAVQRHGLAARCRAVLFSPVFVQAKGLEIAGALGLEPRSLAEWILADRLPVRMQLQMHKFIWEPSARGV